MGYPGFSRGPVELKEYRIQHTDQDNEGVVYTAISAREAARLYGEDVDPQVANDINCELDLWVTNVKTGERQRFTVDLEVQVEAHVTDYIEGED